MSRSYAHVFGSRRPRASRQGRRPVLSQRHVPAEVLEERCLLAAGVVPVVQAVSASGNPLGENANLVVRADGFSVRFSERLDDAGIAAAGRVTNAANWQVLRDGAVVANAIGSISAVGDPATGTTTVDLTLSSALGDGRYVLVAKGTILDKEGEALDGDGNGTAGGDFRRNFTITQPVAAGPEFRINPGGTTNELNTRVWSAADASGGHVLVWSLGGFGPDYFVSRYDRDGKEVGTRKVVSAPYLLALSATADGGFMIADWLDDPDSDDWNVSLIRIRRFDATAAVVRETTVRVPVGGIAGFAMNETGWVLVEQKEGTDRRLHLFARRYDIAGTALGGAVPIDALPTSAGNARVGMGDDGGFAVIWTGGAVASDTDGDLYAQRFRSDGTKIGGNVHVRTAKAGSVDSRYFSLSVNAGGQAVVAWIDDGNGNDGIWARLLQTDGSLGREVLLTQRANAFSPTVRMDGAGNFVVAWTEQDQVHTEENSNDVWALRANASGTKQGEDFFVGTTRFQPQGLPLNSGGGLSVAPDGGFLVIFEGYAPPLGEELAYRLWGRAFRAAPSIGGRVFDDYSADGARALTEPGLAGATVYLDLDKDGVRDANEPWTVSDAGGNYFFWQTAAGTYSVRAVAPAGYRQTVPAGARSASLVVGGSVTGLDFGFYKNHAPDLAAIGARTVLRGRTLTFRARAADRNPQDMLTYSLGPGAPAGAKIDAATGVFTWTPAAGQALGTYKVVVKVADGSGGGDSETIDVTLAVSTADVVGYSGGAWKVAASTGTGFAAPVTWATWSNSAWTALAQGDFDGDGKTDVLGLLGTELRVGRSTGSGFQTSVWGTLWNGTWKNLLVGDVNGDGRDDVFASANGSWYVAFSTGTGFGSPKYWTGTADAAWALAALADVNGDGRDDLVLRYGGEWYVVASTDAISHPVSVWGRWANVGWTTGLADLDGDGRIDVYGLVAGEWYVGRSTGTAFSTSFRAKWANAAWKDVIAADFDNDGRADLTGRLSGQWWVGLSNMAGAQKSVGYWGSWADVAWLDLRAGDFDGDGRADLAGRLGGTWYVARSTGAQFQTNLWGSWSAAEWKAVAASDASGPSVSAVGSGGLNAASGLTAASASATVPRKDDPMALLWSGVEKNEEFADQLLAAV